MLKQLIKLANHLDNIGRVKEADALDSIVLSFNKKAGDHSSGEEWTFEKLKI